MLKLIAGLCIGLGIGIAWGAAGQEGNLPGVSSRGLIYDAQGIPRTWVRAGGVRPDGTDHEMELDQHGYVICSKEKPEGDAH